MVMIHTANEPITFSGQIVAYVHNGTSISGFMQSTDNVPVRFSQAKRIYTTTGGNPSPYVTG